MVVLLTDKPESLDRKEDGRFVYEGLVSANLRQPSGQAWQEFTHEVIDSFFDPQFDGFSNITDPNKVTTFVDYFPDDYLSHYLVFMLCWCWSTREMLPRKLDRLWNETLWNK